MLSGWGSQGIDTPTGLLVCMDPRDSRCDETNDASEFIDQISGGVASLFDFTSELHRDIANPARLGINGEAAYLNILSFLSCEKSHTIHIHEGYK